VALFTIEMKKFVGWLVGWLVGCLVGWLVGWLVGRQTNYLIF